MFKHLGLYDYRNVVGEHDGNMQNSKVQRFQQDKDIMNAKLFIKGFHALFQQVEQISVAQYGLAIMYFDILVQGRATSTVYGWHVDNDDNNNPGGAKIYRTFIVKLSPKGTSVSVDVAGHGTTDYDKCGSYIDFRSAAKHRSVMPTGSDEFENIKVVFFLGSGDRKEDGRFYL